MLETHVSLFYILRKGGVGKGLSPDAEKRKLSESQM